MNISTRAFWLDVADRTSKTFLQNVALFFVAGVTITTVSWATVLGSAALAALVSLLLAISTATALTSGNFLIDTADRAARTFAGSFVGALPATGSSLAEIQWGQAASLAATAALLSVITSLTARNVGAKGLPSIAPVRASDGQVYTVSANFAGMRGVALGTDRRADIRARRW
ncbi:phage r1t holin [Rhodococcus sp. OK611]|uniref:holin n=1 Tax=unclassified Rhodococcus (in: high G+C Gram-positive bacteria) TaxID=192944 RepID=UPI000BD9C3C7|nr:MULTISPECIES: holin [unclassified Rhodococcus (in: high G+C Gram-positive bacteria)]PTR42021.1 phage r1t holin [Rhodococcus sp. OK611]SNX91532.1 phage r1t holin [Rhodococcus sp. OK270]